MTKTLSLRVELEGSHDYSYEDVATYYVGPAGELVILEFPLMWDVQGGSIKRCVWAPGSWRSVQTREVKEQE